MGIMDCFKKVIGSSKSDAVTRKEKDDAALLYKELQSEKFRTYPCETKGLGEGMAIVNEVICGYWKPRFLIDNNAKTAVEFIREFGLIIH